MIVGNVLTEVVGKVPDIYRYLLNLINQAWKIYNYFSQIHYPLSKNKIVNDKD